MMVMYKSGRVVDPINLRSKDLDIRDIAHNLSMICRYTGAFPFHYSVGQHSILLSQMMSVAGHSREACLAGLLHDASEYVFNDLSSEIKHHALLTGYRRLEHETSRMILANYGCDPDLLTIIKPYDELMYISETAVRRGVSKGIMQLMPNTVYHRFLQLFGELTS